MTRLMYSFVFYLFHCIGVFSHVLTILFILPKLTFTSFLLSLLLGGKDYNTITIIRIWYSDHVS